MHQLPAQTLAAIVKGLHQANGSIKTKYTFKAKPWQFEGPNSWTFVSLPKNISKEIRDNFKREEEGLGRLKIMANIGETEWKTSIWFDTKLNIYLLPLKSDIRKKKALSLAKT